MKLKEPKPLEYFDPKRRFESTGTITNEEGQKLEIRVNGEDQDRVREYLAEVRIAFLVQPDSEELPEPEEDPSEEYDIYDVKTMAMLDKKFREVERHPELDLEIELDVVEAPGLEPPYVLEILIDPKISGGQCHFYRTQKPCKKQRVTLSASVNGVYGVLTGGGINPVTGQADVFSAKKKKAKYTATAGANINFFFSVTGLRVNNTYSLGSAVKLVP